MLNRKLLKDIVVWVVPVIGGIATFFSFMLVAVASPFTTRDPRGRRRRASSRACRTRTWSPTRRCSTSATSASRSRSRSPPARCSRGTPTSAGSSRRAAGRSLAWMFLGFGQILGAHWAYVEVGWGGYYAWDPVENAALMPWLAATAFLHSVMIQERKGMLRIWNMVLVALAFELSVFGTFLTRSGVIESIHSFAKSSIGALVPRLRDHHDALLARADPLAAAAARARGRSSSRRSRARRRSSTTTCCSSRSA